jgi:iron complex outermembrane receptor protein
VGFDSKRDKQKLESFTRVDRDSGERTQLNPDRDKTFTDTGVYLQYIAQISENWKGVLGYRIDDDSVIGQQSSARAGVVGQLPYGMVLKVLAGSAFQAPSPELLFRDAVQSGDIIGNPELDAQKASTVEVSIAAPISDFMHISATYFDTTVDDLVVFESDSSNLFAKNSVGSDTEGLEIEARLLWQGVNAYFNYTYQNTTREQNPLSLYVLEHRADGELFPENMANFGITYDWSSVKFSWETRWVGKREASTQNVLAANQFYTLDSYSTSNFSLSTNAFSLIDGKEATLRLQVRDVFDNRHVDPGFGGIDFPSLGQRYSLTFEQRF